MARTLSRPVSEEGRNREGGNLCHETVRCVHGQKPGKCQAKPDQQNALPDFRHGFQERCGAQHTVHKAVEQIDRHGPLSKSGIAVGFPGDYGAYKENGQERDPITGQSYQKPRPISCIHFFVGISAVEDFRCQVYFEGKGQGQTASQVKGKCGQQPSCFCFDPLKPIPFKVVSCQEEGEEYQDAGNAEEVVELRHPHQQSCGDGDEHVARYLFQIRGDKTPEKQGHNVPQGEFRPCKVQACIFMYDEYI